MTFKLMKQLLLLYLISNKGLWGPKAFSLVSLKVPDISDIAPVSLEKLNIKRHSSGTKGLLISRGMWYVTYLLLIACGSDLQ